MCRAGGAIKLLAGPTWAPSLGMLGVNACCAGITEAGLGSVGVGDSWTGPSAVGLEAKSQGVEAQGNSTITVLAKVPPLAKS